MATLGSMIVNVLANTAGFVNGMKTVRSELKQTKAEATMAQTALAGFGSVKSILGGLGIGLSGAVITRSLMSTADEIDRLVKVSDRLGITTENLKGLEFGAALAGVSAEDLSSALGFMSKQLAEAAHGGGKAKDVIKELGLNAQRLATMTPDEALLTFTRALSGVKDESEKVRIAMRVFGNAGQPLLTLLNEGEDAIRGYVEEAKKLGLTYSKEQADKVVAFNDAWEKLGITLSGFGKNIVIDVAPAAIKIVDDLQSLVAKSPGNTPGDVRNSDGKPSVLGRWLPDMLRWDFITDAIARQTVAAAQKTRAPGPGRGTSSVVTGAFSKEELAASRARLRQDFRPGIKTQFETDSPKSGMRLESEIQANLERARQRNIAVLNYGVGKVVSGYAAAVKGLATIDKMGAEWGKRQMINRIFNPPQDPFYSEKIRAAKEAAEKAKQEAEEQAKREAETKRRMTQPAPTAAAGSAASREQIRQSQQQAAQLKEARNANLHLRGIKDALTNPRATGL